ncbi:MAG: acyl-CoA carboxylase subunit beta [Deltaproteobacteria bacterium]|nr:acyl-CoA carboxylase subunit beta [Deltaproteobacteria bacterium]
MGQKKEQLQRFLKAEQKAEEGDAEAIAKQHARGRLTAQERLARLLDPGSFVEIFKFAESRCSEFGMAQKKRPNDGVICGYGRVEGKKVCIFAQDRTVLNASVGGVHGEKIAQTIENARKAGLPCVGLFDSVGARIQESLDSTVSVGKVLHQLAKASGRVPLIAAIMGTCAGVASYSPALSDVVLMVKGAHMFITGPSVVKKQIGEKVTLEELGGWKPHSQKTGLADLVYENDEDCLRGIKKILGYLPANAHQVPGKIDLGDDPERETGQLLDILPDNHLEPYDVRDMIKIIVDHDTFLELKPNFAPGMVTGLGRLDGMVVGFVANQNLHDLGSIDVDVATKAARFIRFCDSFNIPLVTMVDTIGVSVGRDQENRGILRHGAKMMYAYSESKVPKVTLMLRKGYGGAKPAMCTKDLGADQVIGWPFLDLVVLEAKGAVEVLYGDEIKKAPDPEALRREKEKEYEERFRGAGEASSKGFVHRMIEPKDTRKALIEAFIIFRPEDRLKDKNIHGNIPL